MKRTGGLLPQIVEPDNLRLAFWKARKGKTGVAEVEAFRADLDENLLRLRHELLTGMVQVGEYHYFTIYDPKERVICAASFRERVLHHALMNVCHPVFERFQMDCSYATRPGKGTYAALERAQAYNARYTWYLKMDVRKFFDSISHEQLLALLRRKFKDRALLDIFTQIIHSYATAPGRGLPIGNLTSQYFANYYLAFVDHLIRDEIGHGPYVRYMDDMVLWDDDKQRLKDRGRRVAAYLRDTLALELKVWQLNYGSQGLPFLGYRLHGGRVRLSNRAKRRFRRKMDIYAARLAAGDWDQATFQVHVLPLLAYAEWAESWGFRRRVLSSGVAG